VLSLKPLGGELVDVMRTTLVRTEGFASRCLLEPLSELNAVYAIVVPTEAFASCLGLKPGIELAVALANAVRIDVLAS
jgi:hypothetical protein